MDKLVRFGIAMDEELLSRFDRYIRYGCYSCNLQDGALSFCDGGRR
jgi:hypothetical protein